MPRCASPATTRSISAVASDTVTTVSGSLRSRAKRSIRSWSRPCGVPSGPGNQLPGPGRTATTSVLRFLRRRKLAGRARGDERRRGDKARAARAGAHGVGVGTRVAARMAL